MEKQPIISSTPKHYQGTIQPIDLINAQDLNFNLGNVVKYVCRAGKKQGENVLSDLDKAKNYINYEIERIKNKEKWIKDNAKSKQKNKPWKQVSIHRETRFALQCQYRQHCLTQTYQKTKKWFH